VTTAAPAVGAPSERHGVSQFRSLWYRQLDSYPDTAPRMLYLGIVVVATVLLYYELYVPGAVAPTILTHFGMSFRYYVYISVVGNAVGAFTSILAGLADRWGGANMVTYGLVITAVLVLFGIPNAPNKLTFAILTIAVGFVEGIILVATPALVRDFSPQLGRASAMGFWTLGPVVGSLCVAEVSRHTLAHLHAWQAQYIICGIAGLVIFAVALVGLRELSPGLRDQLMVSIHDRALIEARAKGIDVEAALRKPWRQMLHLDVIGSALAVSVMLLFYYAAVGFFVIYFSSIYGWSEAQANALGNWFWAFDAAALVVIGILSDKLRVRKPFMIFGAVGAVVMTFIFLTRTSQPHTSYYTFVLIISLLAVFLAIAYAPWMAGFTETVEKRNPALTATGLAVWGWVIRAVVALSALILPFVVSSMTPLVDYGSQVATIAAKYPALVDVDPVTLSGLAAGNLSLLGKAEGELEAKLHVNSSQALSLLLSAKSAPASDIAYLKAHGLAVANASKAAPSQWKHWWWVCIAGEIVFIPLVFLMAGRWDPRRARRDVEEYERTVDAELARLQGARPATT